MARRAGCEELVFPKSELFPTTHTRQPTLQTCQCKRHTRPLLTPSESVRPPSNHILTPRHQFTHPALLTTYSPYSRCFRALRVIRAMPQTGELSAAPRRRDLLRGTARLDVGLDSSPERDIFSTHAEPCVELTPQCSDRTTLSASSTPSKSTSTTEHSMICLADAINPGSCSHMITWHGHTHFQVRAAFLATTNSSLRA